MPQTDRRREIIDRSLKAEEWRIILLTKNFPRPLPSLDWWEFSTTPHPLKPIPGHSTAYFGAWQFMFSRDQVTSRSELCEHVVEVAETKSLLNVVVSIDDKWIFCGEPEQTEGVGDAMSRR